MAAVHLSALRGRPLLLLSAEVVNGKIFLASRVTGDAAQAHGCCLELETKVAEDYAKFYNHRPLLWPSSGLLLRHYAKQALTHGK